MLWMWRGKHLIDTVFLITFFYCFWLAISGTGIQYQEVVGSSINVYSFTTEETRDMNTVYSSTKLRSPLNLIFIVSIASILKTGYAFQPPTFQKTQSCGFHDEVRPFYCQRQTKGISTTRTRSFEQHNVRLNRYHTSSTYVLNKQEDDDESYIKKISSNINYLEIRLDATLAACFGLCRFLIYDITTGAKEVPGWQMSDFIMLGGAFSSCIVLSGTWSLFGVLTGIFDEKNYDSLIQLRIAVTALIAGPIWVLSEILFGWPPSGSILRTEYGSVSNAIEFGLSESLLIDLFSVVGTGTIGLVSIMYIGRFITSNGLR